MAYQTVEVRDEGFSDQFIRTFKRFLLDHTPLRDNGRRDEHDQSVFLDLRSEELETFRNIRPRYVERFLGPRNRSIRLFPPSHPTYDQFLRHFVNNGQQTLYTVNSAASNVLVLCLDIDAKEGEDDAQTLADHVALNYLNGNAYIEPSRSGSGRHVYFKIDVTYVRRSKLWEIVPRFVEVIKLEETVQKFKSRVDIILGLPTVWTQPDTTKDEYRIQKRGTPWQIPYLVKGWNDFNVLRTMKPVLFEHLDVMSTVATAQALPVIYARDMGRTYEERKLKVLNGREKKVLLVSTMLRDTNGEKPDLDVTYKRYMEECHPSGISFKDDKRRLKEIMRVIDKMSPRYRPSHPHQFKAKGYLELVQKMVPMDAFKWDRREKLDHERFADFVAVKVQDAFFKKQGCRGRASRDATIENFRVMKAKGLVSWICTPNQYTRFLKIAVQYGFLQIVDGFTPPIRNKQGQRIGKGIARMIGPGPVLVEEYEQFKPIVEQFHRLRELIQPMAA